MFHQQKEFYFLHLTKVHAMYIVLLILINKINLSTSTNKYVDHDYAKRGNTGNEMDTDNSIASNFLASYNIRYGNPPSSAMLNNIHTKQLNYTIGVSKNHNNVRVKSSINQKKHRIQNMLNEPEEMPYALEINEKMFDDKFEYELPVKIQLDFCSWKSKEGMCNLIMKCD